MRLVGLDEGESARGAALVSDDAPAGTTDDHGPSGADTGASGALVGRHGGRRHEPVLAGEQETGAGVRVHLLAAEQAPRESHQRAPVSSSDCASSAASASVSSGSKQKPGRSGVDTCHVEPGRVQG